MTVKVKPCESCGGAHCYWCGLPFPHSQSADTRITREHLQPKGFAQRTEAIVSAHGLCNSARGHKFWTPFHERDISPEPPSQRQARECIDAVLNGRPRPRIIASPDKLRQLAKRYRIATEQTVSEITNLTAPLHPIPASESDVEGSPDSEVKE